MEGSSHAVRSTPPGSYIPDGGIGDRGGGGTYTAQSVEPTIDAYQNIFGPSARDIKNDLQRYKRHGRWHLPDILKGPNQYLTDRIDGLITDATNSPFTSRILPYKYITNVDGKIKWNVWSFDEGLSARVPYESAARTLTQTKRSFAGYTVRQGMAIVLEHNFMMTEAGRANFKNQLNQLIGSIQKTNDLDVHVALVLAPSYARHMREKYISDDRTPSQVCREFVDLFGFVQKNSNAMDILIEEAKTILSTWGGPMPDFLLCNSKLTFQLTMTPDVTNYVTHGPEGPKRLKTGPNMQSYRGISIIHSRAFEMETGTPPRDILRRRVRVAEYYHIPPHRENHQRIFQLYNEERDTWFSLTFKDILRYARVDKSGAAGDYDNGKPGFHNHDMIEIAYNFLENYQATAGRVPRIGGPGLGTAVQMDTSSAIIAEDISRFFLAMFNKKLVKEFVWDPASVWGNMVYVPGAFDFFGHSVVTFTPVPMAGVIVPEVPHVIKKALQDFNAPHTIWHGNNRVEQENAYAFAVQAMAFYPRPLQPVTRFARNLELWAGRKNTAAGDNFAAVAAALGVAFDGAAVQQIYTQTSPYVSGGVDPLTHFDNWPAVNAECRRFTVAYLLRNYNRYGMPLVAQNNNPENANHMHLPEVVNLAADITTNVFQQRLRPLGAFLCPNHYKQGHQANFKKIGNQLGYNIIVTQELIRSLTRTAPALVGNADESHHIHGTAIFELLRNPNKPEHKVIIDQLTEVLRLTVSDFNGIAGGRAGRRWELSDYFYENLQTHTSGAMPDNATAKIATAFTTNSIDEDRGCFWTWPKTDLTTEDYLTGTNPHYTNFSTWCLTIANTGAAGINRLQITRHHINTFTNRGGGYRAPLTHDSPFTVNINGRLDTAINYDDTLDFLRMLCWRLYGDQEVPLSSNVDTTMYGWPANITDALYSKRYFFHDFGVGLLPPKDPVEGPGGLNSIGNIEVVMVRPNIEHYMLGIILGQGGEGLGSTFWGQTELSCYDDSMHGIWGMSYKYHERAIVINERNLVRLWDIAYDSYVGGKNDTIVDWKDKASVDALSEFSNDVTRHYRGPSMMVMGFHHGEGERARFRDEYSRDLKPNMPSPLVYYDSLRNVAQENVVDPENAYTIKTDEFRIFHKPIYRNAYVSYKNYMPDFNRLHAIRKNAGQATHENESSTDSLAYQGSMKVLGPNGMRVWEVEGSGHHGPDYSGVSSLRSGKGYKISGQPTIQRLV